MCGIAGFQLASEDVVLRENAGLLARFLLMGIDHRGGDATGAAWIDSDGYVQEAITVGPYRKWRAAFRRSIGRTDLAILHTRLATQGSKLNPRNNHPIISGPVRLVHNGCIWNDDEIFRAYPRIRRNGQVDSEAIVAAIRGEAKAPNGSVTDALEMVAGSMATAWIDERSPDTLWVARGDHSPLVIARTPGGSVLFASVESAIRSAVVNLLGKGAWAGTWIYDVPEGKHYTFRNALIVDKADFLPDAGWGKYAYTSPGKWNDDELDSPAWRDYLEAEYGWSPAGPTDDVPCAICEAYGEPLDSAGWCPTCRYIDEHSPGVIMGPVARPALPAGGGSDE